MLEVDSDVLSPFVKKSNGPCARHEREIDTWISHRLAASEAVTIVGHEDLLALPV